MTLSPGQTLTVGTQLQSDNMHRLAVFNSLHRGLMVAAEIECRDPTRLAFVGVYPLDLADPMTRQFLRNRGFSIFPEAGRAYHVRIFEVERKFIELDVHIGETELLNPGTTSPVGEAGSLYAFDDESLIKQLDKLNVPVERLQPPWKIDYPM
jgi:hypothetical protein